MSVASQWKLKDKEAVAAAAAAAAAPAVAKVGIPAAREKAESSAKDSSCMASVMSTRSKALENQSKPEAQKPSPTQSVAFNTQGFRKLPIVKDNSKNFQAKETDPAPGRDSGQQAGSSAASKIPVGAKESVFSSGGRKDFAAGPKKEEPSVQVKSRWGETKPNTSELNKETTSGAKEPSVQAKSRWEDTKPKTSELKETTSGAKEPSVQVKSRWGNSKSNTAELNKETTSGAKEPSVQVKSRWGDIKPKTSELNKETTSDATEPLVQVKSRWGDTKSKTSELKKETTSGAKEPSVQVKFRWGDTKSKTSELNKETTSVAKVSDDETKASAAATEDGPFGSGRTKGLAGFWAVQTDDVKAVKKKRLTAVEENIVPVVVENTPLLLEGVVRAQDPGEWKKPHQVEDGWTKNVVSSFQKRQQETFAKKTPTSLPEEIPNGQIDYQDTDTMKLKVKGISQRLTVQQNEPSKQPKEKLVIDLSQGAVVLAENQPEDVDPNVVRSDSGSKEEVVLEKGRTRNLLQHWKDTEVEYNAPKTSTARYQGSKPAWILEIEAAKGNSTGSQDDNVDGDDAVAELKADVAVNINAWEARDTEVVSDIRQDMELDKAGGGNTALPPQGARLTKIQHSKPSNEEFWTNTTNEKATKKTEQVNDINDVLLDTLSPTTKPEVLTDLSRNQDGKIEERILTTPVEKVVLKGVDLIQQDYTASLDNVKCHEDFSRESLAMDSKTEGTVLIDNRLETVVPNESIETGRSIQIDSAQVPPTLLIEKEPLNNALIEEKEDMKLLPEEIQIRQKEVHKDETVADAKIYKDVLEEERTNEPDQKCHDDDEIILKDLLIENQLNEKDSDQVVSLDEVKPKQEIHVEDETTRFAENIPTEFSEENVVKLSSDGIKLDQKLLEDLQQIRKTVTEDKPAEAIDVLSTLASDVVDHQLLDVSTNSMQSKTMSKEVKNTESLDTVERIEGTQDTVRSIIEVSSVPPPSLPLLEGSLEHTCAEEDIRKVPNDDVTDVRSHSEANVQFAINKKTLKNQSGDISSDGETLISLATTSLIPKSNTSIMHTMKVTSDVSEAMEISNKTEKQALTVLSCTEGMLLDHHNEPGINEQDIQSLVTADDLLRIDPVSSSLEELTVDNTPCLVPVISTGIPLPSSNSEQKSGSISDGSVRPQKERPVTELTTETLSGNQESNVLPEIAEKRKDDAKKPAVNEKQEAKSDTSQRSCAVM